MEGCQGSNTGRWQIGADPLSVVAVVGIRGRFAKAALVAFQVGAGGREGGEESGMDCLHLAQGLLLVQVEQHKHNYQQQLEKEADNPEN